MKKEWVKRRCGQMKEGGKSCLFENDEVWRVARGTRQTHKTPGAGETEGNYDLGGLCLTRKTFFSKNQDGS